MSRGWIIIWLLWRLGLSFFLLSNLDYNFSGRQIITSWTVFLISWFLLGILTKWSLIIMKRVWQQLYLSSLPRCVFAHIKRSKIKRTILKITSKWSESHQKDKIISVNISEFNSVGKDSLIVIEKPPILFVNTLKLIGGISKQKICDFTFRSIWKVELKAGILSRLIISPKF